MRVLYVNMGGELVAGSEQSLLDLIAAGTDRLEAMVLCNAPALADAARDLGHQAEVAPLVECSPYADSPWSLRGFGESVAAVAQAVRAFDPDLIHANNVWPTQVAVAASQLCHRPVLGHVRATTFFSSRNLSAMRLADHIVAVAETVAQPFRQMRLRRGGVSVVFDPIDTSGASEGPASRKTGPLHLGIAGRLSEEKAVHRAIKLLGWLRTQDVEAELTIYGEGPTRGELEACVAERELGEWVTFAGFCRNLPARLSELDALLLCSRREALPRVILEAGLAGVPSVAVTVGGIAEVVDSGRTGLLVGDFESPACRREILAALRDRSALAHMGEAMARRCREQFAPAACFAAMWAVYQRVVRGWGLRRRRR